MNLEAIDERIEELERQIERLRTLRALLGDPEIEIAAMKALNGAAISQRKSIPTVTARFPEMEREERKQNVSGDTSFLRLRNWFKQRSNEPATIQQMAAFAEVTDSAIRQLIYNSRRDRFEKAGKVKGSRESLYRLRTKAVHDAPTEEGEDAQANENS